MPDNTLIGRACFRGPGAFRRRGIAREATKVARRRNARDRATPGGADTRLPGARVDVVEILGTRIHRLFLGSDHPGSASRCGSADGRSPGQQRRCEQRSRRLARRAGEQRRQPRRVDHTDLGLRSARLVGSSPPPGPHPRGAGRGDFYTDSTGKVSYVETTYGKTGQLNPDLITPQPDVTYVIHPDGGSETYTHVFHTDELGRTDLAYTDHLERGDSDRSRAIQGRIGDLGGTGYDGGHLLANMFGGGPEDVNLVPMLKDVNRGAGQTYGQLENEWRTLLDKNPGTVIEVRVEPHYEGGMLTPDRIDVTWTSDGVPDKARFFNAQS